MSLLFGLRFDFRNPSFAGTTAPAPYRDGGPALLLGGSSDSAARRAARIADGFRPSVPEVWEFYRDEVQRLGRPDPGPCPIGPNRVVALALPPRPEAPPASANADRQGGASEVQRILGLPG